MLFNTNVGGEIELLNQEKFFLSHILIMEPLFGSVQYFLVDIIVLVPLSM